MFLVSSGTQLWLLNSVTEHIAAIFAVDDAGTRLVPAAPGGQENRRKLINQMTHAAELRNKLCTCVSRSADAQQDLGEVV